MKLRLILLDKNARLAPMTSNGKPGIIAALTHPWGRL
jgi:hypothetical protein